MKPQTVTFRPNPDYKPKPLIGTQLKQFIHKTLDLVPMPELTRNKIKGCGGCTNREQMINLAQMKYLTRLAKRRARTANSGTADAGPTGSGR